MNLVLLVTFGALSQVVAFVPSNHHYQRTSQHTLKAAEGTDFDAPILYSPESASGPLDYEPVVDDECYMGKDGQLDECADFDPPKVPVNLRALLEKMEIDFDAPVLYNPASASGPLENEPVVDDECYMGKDGQLDECADFDPPKVPVNLRALMEKIDKKIDYDAPVPYNPQSSSGPLDYEPVVDDECYMGKEGQLDECADFDPPKSGYSAYGILASQEDA